MTEKTILKAFHWVRNLSQDAIFGDHQGERGAFFFVNAKTLAQHEKLPEEMIPTLALLLAILAELEAHWRTINS